MKIQIGEILLGKAGQKLPICNKTLRYLTPCLKKYGVEFEKMYSSVFKIGIGIGDMIILDQERVYEQHLFILLDTRLYPKNFIAFLNWIKEQTFYEDDYVYGDIDKSPCHMIVIKIPDEYKTSFTKFTEGKYSEMFTNKDIEELFHKYPEQTKVFTKDHNYKVKFVGELNRLFGTTVRVKEYNGELDLPPKKEDQFFE
jgi:hypothetical protein